MRTSKYCFVCISLRSWFYLPVHVYIQTAYSFVPSDLSVADSRHGAAGMLRFGIEFGAASVAGPQSDIKKNRKTPRQTLVVYRAFLEFL